MRPPLSCLGAGLLVALSLSALSFSTPAYAIEIDAPHPQPTLEGDATVFSSTVSDVSGTAQIRWDFGDGTQTEFVENGTSAEHTYAAPGHYSVNAVAQDEGGFASATFIHTVYVAPAPGVSQTSSNLVFDQERGLVITANEDNGTITIVDTETLELVVELEAFGDPVALALAPDGKLWVVHRESYAVLIVDLDQRKAVDFFRLPYASQPVGLVFSPEGDAFIPLLALGDVVRVDGQSHEITAQKHVAPMLRGISLSGDGNDLWVTRFISEGDHGEVYRLDAISLETVARYDLAEDTTTEDNDHQGRGLPNYIFSVSLTPDGKQAWVPAKKDNMARGLQRDGLDLTQDNAVRPMVSILDLEADEEIYEERIDLDDRNLPRHVTFTPLGDWAFISVYGSNLVELRDVYARSFVTALRAESLHGPSATVVTEDNQLFVLAENSRTLLVIDVADLLTGVNQATQLVAEIPLVNSEKLSPVVLRGKQVFANGEDKRMASEGYVSCSSCHFEGFEDGLVWDFFGRGEGFRNTTSLLGRRGMGHGRVHWSGNFDEIQDFENPIRAHQAGLGFLTEDQFNTGTVSDPLGDLKAGLNADLDAMAGYVASLDHVPASPYRNPDGSLTAEATAGQILFTDLGCDSCHSGEDFTDSAEGELHDVGTLTEFSGGRLGGPLDGIDTPTLLGIWQTAPYLHDGSAPTLREVFTARNPEDLHGETSTLSETQLDQLVAYLAQIDNELEVSELTLPTGAFFPEAGEGGAGGESGMMSGGGGSATTDTGGAASTEVPASGGASATTGDETTGTSDDTGSDTVDTQTGCGCKQAGQVRAPGTSLSLWALAGLGLTVLRRRRAPYP